MIDKIDNLLENVLWTIVSQKNGLTGLWNI